MSFSFNPQSGMQSGHINANELKGVQEQLALIMQQNSKMKNKRKDDFSVSPQREQTEEDFNESRYSQVIQNGQTIPDEGLVSQTQNLMSDIIKVMKDQELNNQLQMLTDQEISKPVSNFDLKNMINRMHQGISSDQMRLQIARNSNNDSRNISMYQSSILDKSANFGKSKSKSPALSSRTQTIIRKKQMNGEYKPIYQRLDEIKQHHEEVIMRTKGMFPKKEEPIPSFQPQINKNTLKIMQNKQRQSQNWDEFLNHMKDWDEKKISQIRQRQAEKIIELQQSHTFHPVINPSTSTILEKSSTLRSDYDPQNMQNVVNRLYSRMKEKKVRDQQRLQDCMSHSPFKPKINQNSEKLFYKMCNGQKIPFEERIKQKTPQKNKDILTQRDTTPKNAKNNNNILDPIKENEQSTIVLQNFPNSKAQNDFLNKSLLLQNSTILNNFNQQNNSVLNQSIQTQKGQGINIKDQLSLSTSSFLNANMTNSIQSPENKKSQVLSQKSFSMSKNKDKNQSNKSLLSTTKQPADLQKENAYHILITDGEANNNTNMSTNFIDDSKSKRLNTSSKQKQSDTPQRNSISSNFDQNKMLSPIQRNSQQPQQFQIPTGMNNSQVMGATHRLSQSINLSAQKSGSKQTAHQKSEEQNLSPAKTSLNLSYNIRSPRLNHSPLKKSPINYTMTVQNMKAQKDNLTSASKFEVLNTQISPLKDLNNQNEVEYGQNLKYIINLLRKEDPSLLLQKNGQPPLLLSQSSSQQIQQQQQQQQQQSFQQVTGNGTKSEQHKVQKSPIKEK